MDTAAMPDHVFAWFPDRLRRLLLNWGEWGEYGECVTISPEKVFQFCALTNDPNQIHLKKHGHIIVPGKYLSALVTSLLLEYQELVASAGGRKILYVAGELNMVHAVAANIPIAARMKVGSAVRSEDWVMIGLCYEIVRVYTNSQQRSVVMTGKDIIKVRDR